MGIENQGVLYAPDHRFSGDSLTNETLKREAASPFGGIPSDEFMSRIHDLITESFTSHRLDAASSFNLIGKRALYMQVAKFSITHPHIAIRALDVGSGPGIVANGLLSQGVSSVEGMDISPEMVKIASQIHSDRRINFVEGNANEDLPYDDSSFHMVTASYSLLHIKNIDHFFSEVTRILKPGGVVLLLEPNDERKDLYWRNGGGAGLFFPDGIWVNEWYEGANRDGQAMAIPTCYRRDSSIHESMQDAGLIGARYRVLLPDEELIKAFPSIGEKFAAAKRMNLFKGFKPNGNPRKHDDAIIEKEQYITLEE